MKIILFSFLVMMLGTVEWLDSLDAAKEIAAREDKLILLNFSGSDWCGPCIKMIKEVFENEAFLSIASNELVLVRADFPRSKKNKLPIEQQKRNDALAEKYNPLGKFPYTVLLDATGKVLKAWDGYTFASQDTFIRGLTSEVDK
jgi:thioredoxin-related protein